MDGVKQAEFARQMNVNRSTVNRWIQNGRIRLLPNGRIDPEAARRMLAATESPQPQHQARKAQIDAEKAAQPAAPSAPPVDPPAPGMEKLGAALKLETYKLQKAKAEKAQMEADKLAGTLLDKTEVDYVLREFGGALRALIESLPDRLAGELASYQGDSNAIHRSLEAAAAEVLTEMAELMARKAREET